MIKSIRLSVLFFVGVLLLFCQCKKVENIFVPEVILKGRLVDNCNTQKPIAHQLLILETDRGIKLLCDKNYKEVAKTYTNENGEFELRYDQQTCIPHLQISIPDTTGKSNFHLPLLIYVRSKKSDNLGTIYLRPSINYTYRIDSKRAYTVNDTLFYNVIYNWVNGKQDTTYSFITGPFKEGQKLSTFSFTGAKHIHDGLLVTRKEPFFTPIKWYLRSNGATVKGDNFKAFFTGACNENIVAINLDD